MTDLDREHLLQKIVAVSGFVFALLILPVAQHFLVTGQQAGQPEQGTVAGVSTDNTVTNADVPSDPAACVAKKSQDLADLQRFLDGELANAQRVYAAAVQPYQAAIPVLTGDVPAETAALNGLIADETTKYNAKVAQIKSAVDTEVTQISQRDCGVVSTATPAQ